MDAGEPPYNAADTRDRGGGTVPYGLGFFFVVLFLLITLCYGSCIYKRGMRSPPPPTTISFVNTTNHHLADDSHHLNLVRDSQGLDDDVIVSFPTFVYSDPLMANKGGSTADGSNSCCSICLAEYIAADVVRLLPECGHLFHVSCIDTWLKVHPTCPVCRNSPLPPTV